MWVFIALLLGMKLLLTMVTFRLMVINMTLAPLTGMELLLFVVIVLLWGMHSHVLRALLHSLATAITWACG